MPPRKKTTVTKRRVATSATSSPNVEVAPPPCTDPPAAAVEETTDPDAIMNSGSGIEGSGAREGESDLVTKARPAKKRAVVKNREVVSVSVFEKEAETEKLEGLKDERDCIVEETIEEKSTEEVLEVNAGEEKEMVGDGEKLVEVGEEKIEIIDGEKEIEKEGVQEEVKDEGEEIEKIETEELTDGREIEEQHVELEEMVKEEPMEEGEPIEEEPGEEGEPVEEEQQQEEEPVEEEPVEEELVEEGEEEEEEEAIEEEEPMDQEHREEEPIEEEEEEEEEEGEEEVDGMEEEEEEVEEDGEKEGEELEEEEEQEQELEEEEEEAQAQEAGKGDRKEEFTGGDTIEEKRDIAALQDVQHASVDRSGEGEGEDQGLGVMPEPTIYLKSLLPNRKAKEAQIFISQLEKTVVEEDLAKVFARFGEIQSVRIVRHSLTQKSKGYAFLQYSTVEAVEKALSQIKNGTEINGKTVHISASSLENCTLFVSNICKSWSKDQVLEALKGLGVEGIEEIALPEDQKVEGKIKGFAFVEFSNHIDARAALNRLAKPDAVLGCDFSAKVSFAQFPVNHSGEPLAKYKTVYLERIPTSWDGNKIEEICKEYGAIETIKLYRKSRTNKKKDFAFVEFVSQESALSCVEGLSKALLGHGDTKVSVSIARPYARKTGAKFVMHGNFKVAKSNEKIEKEAKISKRSTENVEKDVKIIEVSGESRWKKHKKPKLKEVITQKSKALSPQKTIKKGKKVQKGFPNMKTPKEAPHRHASKKGPNKEAPVLVLPQRSKKRPIKDTPESSKRLYKGKWKVKGMQGIPGIPHPHQSGTKKQKPVKGSKQHQRDAPAFNNERAFKRSRNGHHGDYHSRGSPIDRGLSVKYGYAPAPYPSSTHEPPYTSRAHEPSRYDLPYTSRTYEPGRYEPYAYASGSYHLPRSDMAPHAGYLPPMHHAPRNRHVHEPSGAPYGGGYDRTITYPREPQVIAEPPIPPTSHPAYATYPRYQQPSYPYPTGGSYAADYPPRRSYY